MEGKSINKVVVIIVVVVLMVAVVEGNGGGGGKNHASFSKECYESCFCECGIRKPLFCAALFKQMQAFYVCPW